MPMEHLNLSMRSRNCLITKNCKTIGDVARLTEDQIRVIRNFGKKSAAEVAQKLLCIQEYAPFYGVLETKSRLWSRLNYKRLLLMYLVLPDYIRVLEETQVQYVFWVLT